MPPISDYDRLAGRVDILAGDVQEIRLSLAVREEGMKSTHARLDKIETILSRLTWLLVSGIGMAFVAFLIGGGLSNLPGS
jgi:hypothetical protein